MPETSESLGMNPEQSVSISLEKAAVSTGQFYTSLIDNCLTPGEENLLDKNKDSLNRLPPHLRKLYAEGLDILQQKLDANHQLLEDHQDDTIPFLLRSAFSFWDIDPQTVEEILANVSDDNVELAEPTKGIISLTVSPYFYQLLVEKDVLLEDTGGATIVRDDPSTPAFFIHKDLDDQSYQAEETKKGTQRHETHHLIWGFLEEGKFVRPTNEKDPYTQISFSRFRDELAGYIFSYGPKQGSMLDTIYFLDKNTRSLATDVKTFAELCLHLERKNHGDPYKYLYASLTSQNFRELEDTLAKLTPNGEELKKLHHMFRGWSPPSPTRRKAPQVELSPVSDQVLRDYIEFQLSSLSLKDIRRYHYRYDHLRMFAKAIGADLSKLDTVYNETLKTRLNLPEETTAKILKYPFGFTFDVPLPALPTIDEFMFYFLSLSQMDNPEQMAFYRDILDSSPILRQSIEDKIDLFIQRKLENYRFQTEQDYQKLSPKQKKEFDEDLQKKVDTMRELISNS